MPPVALAPYEVLLLPLNVTDQQTIGLARRLHDELSAAGIEVLLDDRDARAGVKFKDADLIGIPIRITVGQKALQAGNVEIKLRRADESQSVPVAQASARAAELVAQLYAELINN